MKSLLADLGRCFLYYSENSTIQNMWHIVAKYATYSVLWVHKHNYQYAKGREMSKSQIINDNMTLSEKLSAISAAMKAAQQVADDDAKQKDLADIAPADSALVTIVSGE